MTIEEAIYILDQRTTFRDMERFRADDRGMRTGDDGGTEMNKNPIVFYFEKDGGGDV